MRILIFILSLLFFAPPIFAAEEFETSYDVNYQILPDGKANVTQEISLTNKLSNIYATQYSLTLKGGLIENIQAYDEKGPLKTEIRQNNEETNIVLNFNQQVVGTGKTLKFKLTYIALDIAQKKGRVWEITIPRLAEQAAIDNYRLTLAVPKNFGLPAYFKPPPVEQQEEGSYNLFRFTKNQLSSSGINAVFGEFQIFDFTLFYHLENPNSFRGETEIPLPPDTAFQKVTYQKIEPQPLNIRVDNDGNWLAKYTLNPQQKMTITATGKVKLSSQPQEFFPPPTSENLKNNLLAKKFWEVDNPTILQKAQKLKTPKAIYDFVVKTLNYDFERVKEGGERMGALKSLEYPNQAICMEFTDLFIAISRAAGIPAREINGFAYTTNERLKPVGLTVDVLHAWPEYYDEGKKVWIPVDPTWGKTTGGLDYFSKFDLNHFTFVIHGEDSQTPYPPGSYKKNDGQTKDIYVVFGEYEGELKPELKVNFDLPRQIYWGTKNRGKIIVRNYGPTAVYNLKTEIESKGIDLKSSQSLPFTLTIFPPFASKEIEVELKPASLRNFSKGNITVFLNEDLQFVHQLQIGFLPEKLILPLLGIVFALGLLILTKTKFYAKRN
ncbi:MAG: transglutaminase-like domain-containing protein [Microgenomates group bacterium]